MTNNDAPITQNTAVPDNKEFEYIVCYLELINSKKLKNNVYGNMHLPAPAITKRGMDPTAIAAYC